MKQDELCKVKVYQPGSMVGYPCGRKAKMCHEGKYFCGIHDPIKRKEKYDKKRAEWDKKWEQKRLHAAKERESLFQRQLSELLDRPGMLEKLERVYRDNIEFRPMSNVITAIKEAANEQPPHPDKGSIERYCPRYIRTVRGASM